MEEADAKSELERLLNELEKTQALAESAGRRAAGLRKIIDGYVEMFPGLDELIGSGELAARPLDGTPRGAEAVRLIMQERPGDWWLVSELVERLRAQDWLPASDNPANAVRTTLERLAASPESSDIYKERRKFNSGSKVVYSYDPDRAPPEPEPPPVDYHAYVEEPF